MSRHDDTVLTVHKALEDCLAHAAQMRSFGGYCEQQIAETVGVTERTMRLDWEKARLILTEELR